MWLNPAKNLPLWGRWLLQGDGRGRTKLAAGAAARYRVRLFPPPSTTSWSPSPWGEVCLNRLV